MILSLYMYQKFQAALLFTGNQLLDGADQVLITKEDGTVDAIVPVAEAGEDIQQLEGILKILPWIAQIDAFQHWIYTNVNHSITERHNYWQQLSKDFGTGLTDWSGFEDQIATSWQRQLHLFEVPFYYIEYGIAQLGALGVWKNSIDNFDKAIYDYKEALKLGYTKSIPEIYMTANVKFDFSEVYLNELADFIQEELKKL
jgi:oligoendopeptidase F